MNTQTADNPDRRGPAALAVLSAAVVAAVFLLQGRTGFNLADEGFLWYGVQRVLQGEVPIRDFMAYDPGRYYWSAALMRLLTDNGIVALRQSVAVFQWLGLFVALMLAWKLPRRSHPLRLALWCAVFVLWMHPRHKLFDITLSILLVAAIAHLLAQPSRNRYFLTGLTVGLVALFGRNHGVYGAAGSLCAIIYLHVRGGSVRRFGAACGQWLAGIAAGYLPMIVMFLLVPGYAGAFWESVRFLFEFRSTNLPLPVPWPWLADFHGADWTEPARAVILGFFYVGLPLFGIAGLAMALRRRLQGREMAPVPAAAICMTLPYAHYAFSRADVGHLALGIFPFLIGVLSLSATRSRRAGIAVSAGLLLASLIVILPLHPGWQASRAGNWPQVQVARDVLRADPATASDLALLNKLVARYAPQRTFMAAPLWPGAYAAFERKAPVWEIYPIVPRGEQFQRNEIERIKRSKPGFILLIDYALDGRDELRYRNTFPLVEAYVRENYELVQDAAIAPNYRVYKERAGR